MKKQQVVKTANILRGITMASFLPTEQKTEMLSSIDELERAYTAGLGVWLCIECRHEIHECPFCDGAIGESAIVE